MQDKTRFEELFTAGGTVVIDGGLATQCEAMGFDISGTLWSAELLESNPQAIVDAHRAYLDAGAQIIITASYQASRLGFLEAGKSAARADELIVSSVALAERARDEFARDNPGVLQPLVAASVGPYGAAMHDGSEYTGKYGVTSNVLRDFHEHRLHLLDNSNADVLACETVPSFIEAVVLAELLESVHSPAWISFSCSDDAHIGDGTPVVDAVRLFDDHPRVLAIGVNCSKPELMTPLIAVIREADPGKHVIVYPNSGEHFDADDKTWSGPGSGLDWSAAARRWRDAGAGIIGGCCRMGPDQIREIATALSD